MSEAVSKVVQKGMRAVTGLHWVAFCATLLGFGLRASGEADKIGPDQPRRFVTRAEAVRVDVLVTHRGRLVRGLGAQDFGVRDEGVVQEIGLVDEQAEPVNVVCLIDTGGDQSISPRFNRLIRGSQALVDGLRAGDRVALVAFSNSIRFLTPLTTDHSAVRSVLETLRPEGLSMLLDALFAGLVLRHLDPARTLVLVFSHGWGSLGWVSRAQLLDAARRSDAVLYAVSFRYRGITSRDYGQVLDDVASETGGRVLVAAEGHDLGGVFVSILSEFRSRYVLTYVPKGVAPGGWHRLEVTLKGRAGEVKARRGYFGG